MCPICSCPLSLYSARGRWWHGLGVGAKFVGLEKTDY